MRRRSKWNAKPTVVEGIRFASQLEARVYQELRLREKAGEITDLKLQVRYPLKVNGELVTTYVCDFTFHEWLDRAKTHSRHVVADAKGAILPAYRIKRALMKAIHGVVIREL